MINRPHTQKKEILVPKQPIRQQTRLVPPMPSDDTRRRFNNPYTVGVEVEFAGLNLFFPPHKKEKEKNAVKLATSISKTEQGINYLELQVEGCDRQRPCIEAITGPLNVGEPGVASELDYGHEILILMKTLQNSLTQCTIEDFVQLFNNAVVSLEKQYQIFKLEVVGGCEDIEIRAKSTGANVQLNVALPYQTIGMPETVSQLFGFENIPETNFFIAAQLGSQDILDSMETQFPEARLLHSDIPIAKPFSQKKPYSTLYQKMLPHDLPKLPFELTQEISQPSKPVQPPDNIKEKPELRLERLKTKQESIISQVGQYNKFKYEQEIIAKRMRVELERKKEQERKKLIKNIQMIRNEIRSIKHQIDKSIQLEHTVLEKIFSLKEHLRKQQRVQDNLMKEESEIELKLADFKRQDFSHKKIELLRKQKTLIENHSFIKDDIKKIMIGIQKFEGELKEIQEDKEMFLRKREELLLEHKNLTERIESLEAQFIDVMPGQTVRSKKKGTPQISEISPSETVSNEEKEDPKIGEISSPETEMMEEQEIPMLVRQRHREMQHLMSKFITKQVGEGVLTSKERQMKELLIHRQTQHILKEEPISKQDFISARAKIQSLLTELMYQNFIYANRRTIAMPKGGTKAVDAEAKQAFLILIKNSQTNTILKILNNKERKVLYSLLHNSEFLGMLKETIHGYIGHSQEEIIKDIGLYNLDIAIETMIDNLIEKICAPDKETPATFSDVPRLENLILPYQGSDDTFFVVAELRKAANPLNLDFLEPREPSIKTVLRNIYNRS